MAAKTLTPEEICQLHQAIHRDLSRDERAQFVQRREVHTLTSLPAAAVQHAFRETQKLADAVVIAERVGFWYAGEPCEPDDLSFCARCKPNKYPPVVVMTTGSSSAFHAHERCEWLIAGQDRVRRDGGSPAPIERVPLGVAILGGSFACQACLGSGA